MLKFARRNVSPPGGLYFYVVPETDFRIEWPTFDGLELKVREHMYNNDIRVPAGLSAIIEDYMCRHLPESVCVGISDGEFKRVKQLTLWVVRDNTQRLLKHDKPYAPLEIAERVMNKERTYEYEGIEENPKCWVPKAE
jgi:hypothetical protein